MRYETGLFEKAEYFVKIVKKCFLKKLCVRLVLIKVESYLSRKLPKMTIYICI